jgi:hypothetical protein
MLISPSETFKFRITALIVFPISSVRNPIFIYRTPCAVSFVFFPLTLVCLPALGFQITLTFTLVIFPVTDVFVAPDVIASALSISFTSTAHFSNVVFATLIVFD